MTDANTALWARREAAVARGVGSVHQRCAVSGANAEVVDANGDELIDFAAGIAVCNTGHSDPRIVAAVKEQLDRFSHVSFQVMPYEPYIALAEKLNAIAPGDTPKKTLFVTTGAEAVENAVKIARAHTGRRGVVAFRGGYHGRTLLTLAMTGKVFPYKAQFGPMPGDVFHAQFPYTYHGVSEDAAFESLMQVFQTDIEASATAAIILEPVLGEGGFYAPPASFVRRLKAFCEDNGILFIADEIQTGFARTGKMFAIEHFGVEPDLMTVAKALAGGFPIAGVVGAAEIMDAPGVGGLGGTYGGSPLGCAAGLEVLKIIESDGLCARAVAIGEVIKAKLTSLRDAGFNAIGDVRGLGAMIAVEFVKDGDPSAPDPVLTKRIVQEAGKEGLLLLSCGVRGNVIRFLPPLTTPDTVLDKAMDILTHVLRTLEPTEVHTPAPVKLPAE